MAQSKEYMVQQFCECDGKWFKARLPFSGMLSENYETLAGAEEFLELCKQGWNDLVKMDNRYADHLPVYRIATRIVTEWA